MNHTHLDGGSNWHSILGMRVHFNEYLRELMREPIRNITYEKFVNVAASEESRTTRQGCTSRPSSRERLRRA